MEERLHGLREDIDEKTAIFFCNNSVNIATSLLYTNPCTGFVVALGNALQIDSNWSLCVVVGNSSVKINTDRTATEEGTLFYLNQTRQMSGQ
jgi:hypothetical protein